MKVRDGEGRSVLDLVEGLKGSIPNDAAVAQRKFALERCTEILTGAAHSGRFSVPLRITHKCDVVAVVQKHSATMLQWDPNSFE